MIHYHGSPCGGESLWLGKFYTGRHAFVSYANTSDIGIIAETAQSFALDNGAFSFWRNNKPINWEDYFSFVEKWIRHPACDFWIIPDIINGDESANKQLIRDFGFRHLPRSVPVYHLHESFDHLKWLIDNFETIALGSSGQWANPNRSDWWERIHQIMQVLCDNDGVPLRRLHGLRMLNPEVFTHLPLSSADSTNAVYNAMSNRRFGIYKPPSTAQCAMVIADRIESQNSIARYTRYLEPSLFLEVQG